MVTMNQANDIEFLAERAWWPRTGRRNSRTTRRPTPRPWFHREEGQPEGLQGLGRPGGARHAGHPAAPQEHRQRPQHLPFGLGLGLRQPGGKRQERPGVPRQAAEERALFAAGGRDATTTFMQRKIGDVLITFECEAGTHRREFGKGEFELVLPEPDHADRSSRWRWSTRWWTRRARAKAQAHLEYLWSKEGQENAAQNYLRPRDADLLKKYAASSRRSRPSPWMTSSAAPTRPSHPFQDGGSFDQIYTRSRVISRRGAQTRRKAREAPSGRAPIVSASSAAAPWQKVSVPMAIPHRVLPGFGLPWAIRWSPLAAHPAAPGRHGSERPGPGFAR